MKYSKGFGLVEVALILLVVGIIAALVFSFANTKNSAPKAVTPTSDSAQESADIESLPPADKNAYDGWSTCNDTTKHVIFKYPPSWSTSESKKNNSCGIESEIIGVFDSTIITSPVQSGKQFRIEYTTGASNTYKSTINKVLKLPKNAGKQLYVTLDSNESFSSNHIIEMILTESAPKVGNNISWKTISDVTNDGQYIMFRAQLVEPGFNPKHEPVEEYMSNTDYETVLNIFRSFTVK